MAGSEISRKRFLTYGAAGLGALAAPHVACAQANADGRPNILFIVLDQLRSWQDFPSDLPLPAHQRLLAEGRGFTRYHVHQAPCGPSRSVIYTGQHVQKTGVYTNSPSETSYPPDEPPAIPAMDLPTSLPTIGTMLRAAGYYTAYKGKWHLSPLTWEAWRQSPNTFPNTRDLLEPYGFSDYNHYGEDVGLVWKGFGRDGEIAGEAATLMYDFASRDRTGGKPWFLAVNLINPHDIMFFDPFGTGDQPYTSTEEPRPPGSRAAPAVPPYDVDWGKPMPRSFYEDDRSTKPAAQQNRGGRIPRDDEATWRIYQNYYFNCARDGDSHVVTLLDALDRFGLTENTVVVLTGDHGEMGGAHGMIGKGADIYKEAVRVPLIVRHPDVAGGTSTDALAGAVDLAPTLLSLAGLDAGERAERFPDLVGVDVSAAVADPAARTERDQRGHLYDYVTAGGLTAEGPNPENRGRGLIRGVHDGRYKFARYFATAEHHIPRDWETLIAHNDLELYDLESDPDEIVNLAREPDAQRELILGLNEKVNALIEREVGTDDGALYPGPEGAYELKA